MAGRLTKLIPTKDRVLVEKLPLDKELRFKSGLTIEIPDTALGNEPVVYATVLKTGPKVEGIKEGEIVGYMNGSGMEINETNDGIKTTLVIIRDQDLMVIVDQ